MTGVVMLAFVLVSVLLVAMGHQLLSDLFSHLEVLETDPVFARDHYTCPQCETIWHFLGDEVHHKGCLAHLVRRTKCQTQPSA
jgi:uncharacterized damage-inducible protein DinB